MKRIYSYGEVVYFNSKSKEHRIGMPAFINKSIKDYAFNGKFHSCNGFANAVVEKFNMIGDFYIPTEISKKYFLYGSAININSSNLVL